jgi:hypothetical protein
MATHPFPVLLHSYRDISASAARPVATLVSSPSVIYDSEFEPLISTVPCSIAEDLDGDGIMHFTAAGRPTVRVCTFPVHNPSFSLEL